VTLQLKEKNALLRAELGHLVKQYPDLQEDADKGFLLTRLDGPPLGDPPERRKQKEIAFLEDEQAFLQKRARRLIACRPEFEAGFNGLI
jgi:hypothetical protein